MGEQYLSSLLLAIQKRVITFFVQTFYYFEFSVQLFCEAQ